MTLHRWITAAVLTGLAAPPAGAQAPGTRAQDPAAETRIQVRVLARDAKLIGDAVGGARVTVTNAETGGA